MGKNVNLYILLYELEHVVEFVELLIHRPSPKADITED
jgi:hypothetical protein